MPTVFTYVLAYAASSAGLAVGTTLLVAAGYAITGALFVGYVASQRRKAKQRARDAYNNSLQDRLVMTATADGAKSRVYGRVRNVDGVVFKQTHGTHKEFYTLVISLAGHEIDAIETVYFNDIPVTLDGSGYVTTEPWASSKPESDSETITISGGAGSKTLANTPLSGSVSVVISEGSGDSATSHTLAPTVVGSLVTVSGSPVDGTGRVYYQYTEQSPKARVRQYLGGPSQNLYADLSAIVGTDLLEPTDAFAGDATLIVTLEYSQDAFPTGVPQISAVIRGAKILDPRTGVTAWSQNPALIARDWALYTYGGGASSSELVESAFTAAANACDVSTNFTTDAGIETRPLYECGIVCPLDAEPTAALDEIVEAMAGRWGWSGGKLTLRAGVYRAPVTTITEAWITDKAPIEIVAQTATADLINVMRPSISDAAQDYVVTPTAEVRYTAAITADGRELPREVPLNGVTRAVHAQHVCGVLMREQREGLTVKLPLNMRGLQLELFDVVQVTLSRFGWNAKLFEVLKWDFSLDAGVMVTLRETAAAVFDPDASFSTLDIAANTELPDPATVEQVTNVTITSGTSDELDKSLLVRTTVTWDAVADQAVRQAGKIEIQYALGGVALPSGEWPSLIFEGNSTSAVIVGLRAKSVYVFRVRARNTLGVRGAWSVLKAHKVADAPLVDRDIIAADATGELIIGASGYTGETAITTAYGSPTAFSLGVYGLTEFTLTESASVVITCSYEIGVTVGADAYIWGDHFIVLRDSSTRHDQKQVRQPMANGSVFRAPMTLSLATTLAAGTYYAGATVDGHTASDRPDPTTDVTTSVVIRYR